MTWDARDGLPGEAAHTGHGDMGHTGTLVTLLTPGMVTLGIQNHSGDTGHKGLLLTLMMILITLGVCFEPEIFCNLVIQFCVFQKCMYFTLM